MINNFLRRRFENGRLKVPKGLPLADALLGELRAFQVQFTAKGRDTTYAARSGEHDDMKRLKTANRHQGRAPIKHGLVGNGFWLAYGGF